VKVPAQSTTQAGIKKCYRSNERVSIKVRFKQLPVPCSTCNLVGVTKEILLESQINVEESYGLPFSISATCTVLTTPTTPPEQSQAIEWIYTDFRDHSNCFDKWDPIQEKKFLVAAKRWQMNRFQSRLCSSIILPRH